MSPALVKNQNGVRFALFTDVPVPTSSYCGLALILIFYNL